MIATAITVTSWLILSPKAPPDPVPATTDQMMADTSSPYASYTQEAFASSSSLRRVYFFHAKWCPTCKAADAAFRANLNQIPDDVAIFITDYDTEAQLKQRYGITYQHTFVQVDAQGNELSKWNGGDISALLTNLK